MRVLITGVTGFIGRALTSELTASGHEVVGLSRNARRARDAVPKLTQAYSWGFPFDPLPPESLGGVDAVVHLMGESVAGRWTRGKKSLIRDSRVLSTQALVNAMRELSERPHVLVNGSAVGYYGHRADDSLDESEPAGSDFLALVGRDWEASAIGAEEFGMRVVRFRTGLVVGPDRGFLKSMLPLYKLGLGGPLGSGRQWWSWIHIQDVVGLLRYAIEHASVSGALNGTSPNPVRQAAFARTLGKVLRRPAFLPAPALLLKLVLGEFSGEVLTSKRVMPTTAEASGYTFAFPQLEPALRDALRLSE